MSSENESLVVAMTPDELHLLVEALDAYEYWQLGDILPRDNGLVFLPDDEGAERYWDPGKPLTRDELEAVELARACRRLAGRLSPHSLAG